MVSDCATGKPTSMNDSASFVLSLSVCPGSGHLPTAPFLSKHGGLSVTTRIAGQPTGLFLDMAFALGSFWALVPAVLASALLVPRTSWERSAATCRAPRVRGLL